MKKIINGKRYDTNTATDIAQAQILRQSGGYHPQTLYRTKSGAWFLHDKYDSERIAPISNSHARQWLESEGETSTIERWFMPVSA